MRFKNHEGDDYSNGQNRIISANSEVEVLERKDYELGREV